MAYPKEVPILSARDICRGQEETQGEEVTMSSTKLAAAREAVCRPLVDALKKASDVLGNDDPLSSALLFVAILDAGDSGISEVDIQKIIDWGQDVVLAMNALMFTLCGVNTITVVDGKVTFSIVSPEHLLETLIKEGLAIEPQAKT